MKSVKNVTVKARDHACSEGFGDLGSVAAMPTAVGEVCGCRHSRSLQAKKADTKRSRPMKSVKHVTVKARDHACSKGLGVKTL